MTKNNEFLTLYNQMDVLLRKKYNIASRSISCVKRYEDELKKSIHRSIRGRGFALESIRTIRNTLIHDAKIYNYDAFIISDEVISFLKNEIEMLMYPTKIIDIAIKKDQVFLITKDDEIAKTITYMASHKLSHAPIVDETGRVIGVFSESTLYAYLLANHHLNITDKMKIGELLNYTALDKHISERFLFVKESELLIDLKEDFIKKSKEEKRLAMIFITKNGSDFEPILGIITALDLFLLNEKK